MAKSNVTITRSSNNVGSNILGVTLVEILPFLWRLGSFTDTETEVNNQID